jgi:hypothetical protein
MFGAKGDGVTDDTEAIQNAINSLIPGGMLFIPCGTYMVSRDITLISNINVIGNGDNSVIKRTANSDNNYALFLLNNVENTNITNLVLMGDGDIHLGNEGEWGMCLSIKGCKNISVQSCKLLNGWGDGIYIGSSGGIGCNNIMVDNCIIDKNRRNGISVINCDGLIVRNSRLTNTLGTDPKSAIDFEANYNTESVTDVIVENCYFKGNSKSVIIGNSIIPYEITVINCISYDSAGVYITSTTDENVKGFIDVRNCVFRSTYGFVILGKSVNGLKVYINHCDFYCTQICVDYGSTSLLSDYVYGGLYMVGCKIYNNSADICPIRVINKATTSSYSDMVFDITISANVKRSIYFDTVNTGECFLKINGKRHKYASSCDLYKYNVVTELDLDTTTKVLTITCAENFPYGVPVKIRNIGSANTVNVSLSAGSFPQFENVSLIKVGKNYDEIILVHEKSGVWSIVDNTLNGVTKGV